VECKKIVSESCAGAACSSCGRRRTVSAGARQDASIRECLELESKWGHWRSPPLSRLRDLWVKDVRSRARKELQYSSLNNYRCLRGGSLLLSRN